MTKEIFLILNLALAFYNVGTIWAHEIDIFRTWKFLDVKTFHIVRGAHWKKLPYWVFIPVGVAFIGSIILFWYHPDKISTSQIWIAFALQFLSHLLTGIFWGPWQAKLSKDESGGTSPYLNKILKTHWIRTALIKCLWTYATLYDHSNFIIVFHDKNIVDIAIYRNNFFNPAKLNVVVKNIQVGKGIITSPICFKKSRSDSHRIIISVS